jgi:hypothetical protein
MFVLVCHFFFSFDLTSSQHQDHTTKGAEPVLFPLVVAISLQILLYPFSTANTMSPIRALLAVVALLSVSTSGANTGQGKQLPTHLVNDCTD